jgi:hypothetical protein
MTRVFRSVVPSGAKPRGPPQTGIPFRAGDAFFEPGAAGKILVAGAVEVIDRTAWQAQAEAQGCEVSRHPFWPRAPGGNRRQPVLMQLENLLDNFSAEVGLFALVSKGSSACLPDLEQRKH